MTTKQWEVSKHIEENGKLLYFDVVFQGSKSSCEKYMKNNGGNLHLGYDITPEEFQWFDSYGNLVKEIPEECVNDCSASGDVSQAVKEWTLKLEFVVPSLKQARNYLDEFGAWDDLNRQGSFSLAQKVLWIGCCDIKENGDWIGLIH